MPEIPRTLNIPHQVMVIDDGNDVIFVLRSHDQQKATLTKDDLEKIARYVWDIATRQAQLDG